jgi:hypothetical protein
METTKGKIVGLTALVAALAGLVTGGIDLYKTVLKIPDNVYDRTNSELFQKHFNKTPISSTPVQVKVSSVTVEMLLQVYESGDVFVRYGEFQQWLPFKRPKVANQLAFSLFTQAHAQAAVSPSTTPAPGKTGSTLGGGWDFQAGTGYVVDIDKLRRQNTDSPAPASTDTWKKAFAVSEIQDDHALSPTARIYTKVFRADPGFKFTKVDVDLGSAKHAKVEAAQITEDGKAISVKYRLKSGPFYDRYRAWIHATVKTEQVKAD